MEKNLKTKSLVKPYHSKKEACYTRSKYRESRWEKAVKVYTINQESKYLLVQNVPCVRASRELVEQFALYGEVEEYRELPDYPKEEFTEVYLIKYRRIQSARFGKRKLDNYSFFGGQIHVCYAPEYENVNDVREKLNERRRIVAKKCKELDASIPSETSVPEGINTSNSTSNNKQLQQKSDGSNTQSSAVQSSAQKVNSVEVSSTLQDDKQELPRISSSHATLPLHIQTLPIQEVYPSQPCTFISNELYRIPDTDTNSKPAEVSEAVATENKSCILPRKKRIVWNSFATASSKEPKAWNPPSSTMNVTNYSNVVEGFPSSSSEVCRQPMQKKRRKDDGRKRI